MTKLDVIQKVFAVFKIIARIGMIVCYVVGGLALASGIIYLSNGEMMLFKVGGTTIYLPFVYQFGADAVGDPKIGWTMVFGGVGALFEGILLTLAHRYFTIEQKEGTPFTENSAKALLTLGILSIVVSVIENSLKLGIIKLMELPNFTEDFYGIWGVALGICLILFSLVAKYGADLEYKIKTDKPAKSDDNSLPTDKTDIK